MVFPQRSHAPAARSAMVRRTAGVGPVLRGGRGFVSPRFSSLAGDMPLVAARGVLRVRGLRFTTSLFLRALPLPGSAGTYTGLPQPRLDGSRLRIQRSGDASTRTGAG